MFLTFTRHQVEGGAEFGVQRLRGIPSDLKPAATCWAVVREGRDKDEAARANGFAYFGDVACAIRRLSEKVEGSPVMPDRVAGLRQRRVQNIGLDPSDGISPHAETNTDYGECGG